MKIKSPTSSTEISDLMVTNFKNIGPDDDVYFAAKVMKTERLGYLIVTDDSDHILGVISERDIITKVVAENKNTFRVLIRDIMTTPAIVAQKENTIHRILDKMADYKLRRIPILSGLKVVGVISQTDLIKSYPQLLTSFKW
jgi:CBS domain-containing protein